ncbi:MAG: flagellar protein FlaG [Pseudomonadota bacterium]
MQKIEGIPKAAVALPQNATQANQTKEAPSASSDVVRADGPAEAAPATLPEPTATESVSSEALEQALEQIREQAQRVAPQLKFENDSESDVVVIKVIDRATGEVIRQLPPEAVVDAQAQGIEGLPSLIADFA